MQLQLRKEDADPAPLLQAQSDLQSTLARIIDLQEKATVARVKLERAAGGAGLAARLLAAASMPATAPSPSGTGTRP